MFRENDLAKKYIFNEFSSGKYLKLIRANKTKRRVLYDKDAV
jgi:hypothetical protein